MKPSFSVLFFSDLRTDKQDSDKYHFMRDVTKFVDQHGFEAIYLPERHFSEFGSIYSNPALIASWLAPQTQHIRFRTAGVSLPLHHPAEVVEWWSTVDVLSGGRVDLGFGSGWHKADFILSPDNYHDRRNIMSSRIETVKRLWRGEEINFDGTDGEQFPIRCFPRAVQRDLNVWILVAQNDEGFRFAGAAGYNVFTMLYGYSLEQLGEKIKIYREARRAAGHDENGGKVTLMLHTLVMDDATLVMPAVKAPFTEYIRSSMTAHLAVRGGEQGAAAFSAEEKEAIIQYSFQRYYKTGALFGTPQDCRSVVEKAIAADVNEIACVMDFGVDYSVVKDSLPSLAKLVAMYR